ncbi:MAG: tripartite tricarboxylate transporter TctB family protein [Aquisalimonadaceae bacterium]
MKSRDYQDLIGGGLLTAIGLFAAIYASQWNFGSMTRMGPGFFPTVVGILLALTGVLIAALALKRTGTMPSMQWRTMAYVFGGIILFSATLRSLGLVTAVFLTVILSSLADRETTWRLRLVLAVSITGFVVLVFRFGLNMVLPLWWGD